MDDLKVWLSTELEKRHWSQRELARQSGISQALVWQVLSGDVPPSADFCVKVAHVLGEPAEKVLRLAGILPPASEDEQTVKEIVDLARNMTTENRQDLLNYARYRYQQQQAKKSESDNRSTTGRN